MKKNPLVSIIIPYFKKRSYIDKTLKSVIAQTYKKYEIIIIYDDINLQDYFYLKRKYIKKKNIKILINKKNLGAGYSRNKGIINSRGKYIAFIDSDDLWHKNKLQYQIKFMENNNILISHSSYNIICDNKIIGHRIAKKLNFKKILTSCDIGLSTVIIKKNLLLKFKFPNIKTKEDFVLWLKILKSGLNIYPIKQKLSSWRKVKSSLSSNSLQKLYDGYLVYRVYLKYSVLRSFYNLMLLSLNYLLKKIKYD